jgi:NADH-quinone oxidoreductase subunit L
MGGHHELHHFLSPVLTSEKAHHIEHSTEWMLMGISVTIAAIAILFAVNKFSKKPEMQDAEGFGKVLANKWYVDELYDTIIVKPILHIAELFKTIVEKSGIDGAVNGVGKFVQYSSRQVRLLQSGQVGTYILFMVLSFVVIVLIWINDGHIYRFITKIF